MQQRADRFRGKARSGRNEYVGPPASVQSEQPPITFADNETRGAFNHAGDISGARPKLSVVPAERSCRRIQRGRTTRITRLA